jgi:CcmD family protein
MNSVFAAYTVVFVGIFIFIWMISARQKRLEKKLEQIKAQLKDSTRQ